MALRALHRGVRPGQRIVRICRVVELGVEPVRSRMAGVARVRQSQSNVTWIIAVIEVGGMAAIAVPR